MIAIICHKSYKGSLTFSSFIIILTYFQVLGKKVLKQVQQEIKSIRKQKSYIMRSWLKPWHTALFRQKRYQIKILTSFLEIYIHFYSILQTPHDAMSNISRYFENPLIIEKKIFGTFIIIFLDKNGKMKMQGPNFFFNFQNFSKCPFKICLFKNQESKDLIIIFISSDRNLEAPKEPLGA